MKRTILSVNRQKSVVVCRREALAKELGPMRGQLLDEGALILTDANVYDIYRNQLSEYLDGIPIYVLPAGEETKSGQMLLTVLEMMAGKKLRRNSSLIAFGGGVIGDLGGLAASLYMRGISCIQIPTSLLAQVDASVGGKTAIDLCGVKNIAGTFHQPARVLVDPAYIRSLPRREIRCGLGEIVKHGALSPALFEKLYTADDLYDLRFIASIIPDNIAVKADIVKRDPLEQGLRKCLNLGHTTAHAIELGQRRLSHGECVLIGIMYEAELAKRYTSCDAAYLGRLEEICRSILLPGSWRVNFTSAAESAALDKENETRDTVVAVVPTYAGKYEILRLPAEDYMRSLGEIRESLC